MGLGGAIGIGSKKGSSSFSEKSNTSTNTTSNKDSTAKSSATGLENTASVRDNSSQSLSKSDALSTNLSSISSLDEGTLSSLRGLIDSLSAGAGGVADVAQNRAINADAELKGITDPIVANARATGERRLGQTQQALARSAGSSQNSLVQQFGLEEAGRIDQEVASLSASLGLQERQVATGELATASQSAGGSLIAQLADVLKGADVTREDTGTQSTTENTVQTLQDVLNQIVNSQQDSTSSESELLKSLIEEVKNSSGSGSSKEKSLGASLSFSGG